MHKLRTPSQALTPEELFAANEQEKAITANGRRLLSLRRVIALADDFKQELFVQLLQVRPELSGNGGDVLLYGEYSEAIEGFLKSSLDKEGLKFSDDVFSALYLDFLHDLGTRSRQNKPDAPPEVLLE
jgi:hypothetical protein